MKVLIISLSGIGNTVLFTPTLELIKKNLPDSHVTMLVLNNTFKEIIDTNPYVDEIFTFSGARTILQRIKFVCSLREKKYDVSIVAFPSNRIQYNLLSFLIGAKKRIAHSYPVGYIRTLAFLQNERVEAIYGIHDVIQNSHLLRPLGIKDSVPQRPEIFLTENDIQFADRFLKENGIETTDLIIGIHPGSSKGLSAKRWPEEHFARVIDYLIEKHHDSKVILFGGPDEIDTVLKINEISNNKPILAIDNTLKQTASIIRRCTLLLNVDSGLGHIASGLSVPTVTIFGPADPKRVMPYGEKNTIVKSNLPCSPCYRYPFYQTNDRIHCKTVDCMKQIFDGEVVCVVENELRKVFTSKK